jgi:hypothetical protein
MFNLRSFLIVVLGISSTLALASDKGATLFEQKCSSCHLKQRPHIDQMHLMAAPPIQGVMFHVSKKYPTKKEAVEFITDYVFNPERNKAVCMAHSIEKFGIMSSQKGNLTPQEAKFIAEYLFDSYPQ